MVRSLYKGIFVCSSLLKKIAKYKEAEAQGKYFSVKTYSRASMILPNMIGMNISVHNGKKFIEVKIGEKMLGHRLGEFALTRVATANHKIDPKKVKK
ncbi:MAG: 30S ribosomal protein S19 [Pseudomonadota bacterium]